MLITAHKNLVVSKHEACKMSVSVTRGSKVGFDLNYFWNEIFYE